MIIDAEWVMAVLLFSAILIAGVCGGVYALAKTHRTTEDIEQEWEEAEEAVDEAPLIEQHVYVLEKVCTATVEGIKHPVCRETYALIVRSDEGETKTHVVDREIWMTVPDRGFGTLAFVGDRVYGFCED